MFLSNKSRSGSRKEEKGEEEMKNKREREEDHVALLDYFFSGGANFSLPKA